MLMFTNILETECFQRKSSLYSYIKKGNEPKLISTPQKETEFYSRFETKTSVIPFTEMLQR